MIDRAPDGMFEYFVQLGAERTYSQVAEHFGVCKRTVQNHADREHWQPRLEAIEKEAQARIDARMVDEVEQMRQRHAKLLRAMEARAAKAMAEHPLASGMEGIRAAEIAIKLQRLHAGLVSDRTETVVADVTREEMRRLLKPEDAPEDDWPTPEQA